VTYGVYLHHIPEVDPGTPLPVEEMYAVESLHGPFYDRSYIERTAIQILYSGDAGHYRRVIDLKIDGKMRWAAEQCIYGPYRKPGDRADIYFCELNQAIAQIRANDRKEAEWIAHYEKSWREEAAKRKHQEEARDRSMEQTREEILRMEERMRHQEQIENARKVESYRDRTSNDVIYIYNMFRNFQDQRTSSGRRVGKLFSFV